MSFNRRKQEAAAQEARERREAERLESVREAGSRTQQQFRKKQDINRIVRDYNQSGIWDHVMREQPLYGDFTGARTLQDAMNLTRSAETDFMRLPASVRQAAANDPVQFLDMLATKEGAQELCNAGLPVNGLEPQPLVEPEPEAPPAERGTREDVASQNVPVPRGSEQGAPGGGDQRADESSTAK